MSDDFSFDSMVSGWVDDGKSFATRTVQDAAGAAAKKVVNAAFNAAKRAAGGPAGAAHPASIPGGQAAALHPIAPGQQLGRSDSAGTILDQAMFNDGYRFDVDGNLRQYVDLRTAAAVAARPTGQAVADPNALPGNPAGSKKAGKAGAYWTPVKMAVAAGVTLALGVGGVVLAKVLKK